MNEILNIDRNTLNLFNKFAVVPYLRYGKVFALFIQQKLIGFAFFIKIWDNPKSAYLAEIAIKKESQGKGCGSYLLFKALSHLKKNGISAVSLVVDPNNSRAKHIYLEKFCFELKEYRKNEYGKGYDRLFLTLNLEKLSRAHLPRIMTEEA